MAALASRTAELLAFSAPGMGIRAALMPQLKLHRLPEHLIDAILREAAALPVCGIDQALTEVLAARMRFSPLDFTRTRRLFVIGPAGAGVSSVAAKLRHHAVAQGLSVAIEDRSFHPRNARARAAFGCIGEREDVETIGVVSALADAEEIGETIAAFRLGRIIVTGLDLVRRCGSLAAAVTQGARLAHVSRSPRADAPLEILSPRDLAALLLH